VPPPETLSLYSAAIPLGSPASNPWPDLLQLIIEKKVIAWQRKSQGPVSFCVAVLLDEIEDQLGLKRLWACEAETTISHQDAIRLLGTNGTVLYALFDAGKLPRKLRLSHLQIFARKNALTGELLGHLASRGISTAPRVLIQQLQERGLSPTPLERGGMKRWVWPRAEAESAIRDILAT